MVKTVGPASTAHGPAGTRRILPPGRGAASTSVTGRPAAASLSAATSPPIPAPITTTRSCATPLISRRNSVNLS